MGHYDGTWAVYQLTYPTTYDGGTTAGINYVNNGDGSWTMTGVSTAGASDRKSLSPLSCETGHVYLIDPQPSDPSLYGEGLFCLIAIRGSTSRTQKAIYNPGGTILEATYDWTLLRGFAASGADLSEGLTIWPQVFDLTAMFGAEAAAEALAMETAEPGAGVAWFRERFPEKYYPPGTRYDPVPVSSAQQPEVVTVYNQIGQPLAVLDNATDIGYELKHNDLWTATFSLPAPDPKNEFCQAHNLVRITDGTRDTGLFRIVSMPSAEETARGGIRVYSLEHVMATLLDDVLFGYHEIGGDGVTTADVITYILSQQTTERWQLGVCDFTDQYQYHFENVSLLTALLSLGETILSDYTWEFNTNTTPWTVNLREADASPGCGIHYGRNLVGIQKTMDATALVTRLYPLGYGEGVNQLTIRDVNGGNAYITADTVNVWGVKSSVWTDTRIEDPALLLARARQILEGVKNPAITYTAAAVDLFRQTGYSWDNFMPGKLVTVEDEEHGIRFTARIVSIRKDSLRGDPGQIEITIANTARDTAEAINTLADRVGIHELYSQGATNLFAQTFADNADATHPAVFRVYVPGGLRRINKMLLSWQLANFRAYETAAASGGGTVQTTSSKEVVQCTSEVGGQCSVTTPMTIYNTGSSIGAVGDAISEESMGGSYTSNECNPPLMTTEDGAHSHTVDSHAHGLGSHTHTLAGHIHAVDDQAILTYGPSPDTTGAASGYTGYNNPGTDSQGAHTHQVNSHYHSFAHTHDLVRVTIPPLTVNVPDHTHNVRVPAHDHTVTIPYHTHGITYGIYEGGRASSVTLVVDGTTVPAADMPTGANGEIDVTAWLDKDQDGKITRNAWHEIQIVPDTLTRIEANLFAQCFIQSVGGGDY